MADILNLDKTPLYTTPGGTTYLVPGPGAEAIEQIINATWAEAQANKAKFATKLATALSGFLDTTNTPHITAGSVAIPAISEPAVSIPSMQSAGDVITEFGSQRLAIVAELIQKFSDFKVTYFPDEANAYIAAEDWLQAAIADPSGLPPAVVAQIFGDDQARILEDKSRAQDAVIAQFAGRRFPLLPDVAASITMQIEQKAQAFPRAARSQRPGKSLQHESQGQGRKKESCVKLHDFPPQRGCAGMLRPAPRVAGRTAPCKAPSRESARARENACAPDAFRSKMAVSPR